MLIQFFSAKAKFSSIAVTGKKIQRKYGAEFTSFGSAPPDQKKRKMRSSRAPTVQSTRAEAEHQQCNATRAEAEHRREAEYLKNRGRRHAGKKRK